MELWQCALLLGVEDSYVPGAGGSDSRALLRARVDAAAEGRHLTFKE